MNNIILEGLGNHYTKNITKYKIKVNDVININEHYNKCKVTKINNNYIEVLFNNKKCNYKQKLTLNNLFTPIKEFKELKESYIIKDKKDKNYCKDFRFIQLNQ